MNLIKVRLGNSKFHSANVMKTQHSVIKVFHSDIGTNDQVDHAQLHFKMPTKSCS